MLKKKKSLRIVYELGDFCYPQGNRKRGCGNRGTLTFHPKRCIHAPQRIIVGTEEHMDAVGEIVHAEPFPHQGSLDNPNFFHIIPHDPAPTKEQLDSMIAQGGTGLLEIVGIRGCLCEAAKSKQYRLRLEVTGIRASKKHPQIYLISGTCTSPDFDTADPKLFEAYYDADHVSLAAEYERCRTRMVGIRYGWIHLRSQR